MLPLKFWNQSEKVTQFNISIQVLSSLSEKLSRFNDKSTMYTVYYIERWSKCIEQVIIPLAINTAPAVLVY